MKKLLIDLDLYDDKRGEHFGCDYFYHSGNKGVRSLLELAVYSLICRKCEEAACILSCPNEALGRDEKDKILRKYNIKCTSCKSCVSGCPFGTIYPEMMTYLVPRCDLCIEKLNREEIPFCVAKTPGTVLRFGDFKEDEANNVFAVGKNLLVKAERWNRNGADKKKH